jgi:GT2 family glycosyltransferase
MNEKKVFIVLINYNQWELTTQCLKSLAELTWRNFEVVIVDNASNASAPSWDEFPFKTILIENSENRGFGAACNIGMRYGIDNGAAYIWLLNNDTIVDAGALIALVEKLEESPANGAAGSMLLNEDGTLQTVGGGFVRMPGCYTLNNFDLAVAGELDFLTGASILLRSEVLSRDSLFFDENIFLYWEDVDLCWRLRKKGWKLAVAVDSRIVHLEGASIRNEALKDARSFKSVMYFAAMHSNRLLFSKCRIVFDRVIKKLLKMRFLWFFKFIKYSLSLDK